MSTSRAEESMKTNNGFCSTSLLIFLFLNSDSLILQGFKDFNKDFKAVNARQRSIPTRAQVLYNAGMDDEASDILPIAKEKVAGAQRTGEAIEFLVRAVGKKESIKKIISQCPQILERNVSAGLQPTYDFLIMIYGEDMAKRLELHEKT